MKRPGFRTSRPSGQSEFPSRDRQNFARALQGGATPQQSASSDESMNIAPFSQVQILHLMKSEFARARRHGYALACCVIGLDSGALVAEERRPEFRSRLRTRLAEVVAGQTREHDHLGMLQDDRFVLLLAYTDTTAAQYVGERILGAFEDGLEIDGTSLPVRLSIGISAATGSDTLFFDTLVSQAEIALDWAAREGGDVVRSFRRDRFVDLEGPAEGGAVSGDPGTGPEDSES